MIFSDEPYSEIYTREPPGSLLESGGADYKNIAVFQSLSKRSNLPGMRVGFVAGDRKFLTAFHELRNVAAPQVPVPLQQVAVACYNDEAHVEEKSQALSAEVRSRRPEPRQPLWLQAASRRVLLLARYLRARQ